MTRPLPFEIIGPARTGRWLVACDHASNRVPDDIAVDGICGLGLPPAEMARHIAYDIGARGVTVALSELLDSPAIASTFSRLVIDPNRGADDPTLVRKIYDGTIIPANRHADNAEITRRIDTYYRPYHDTYEALAARRADTVIVAVHSFTPQLKSRPRRPWQIGILSAYDKRLTDPLIAAMETSPALLAAADRLGERLCIGNNEPYDGWFAGDAIDQHALRKGRLNVLIELRSDLIETPDAQRHWAHLLAPILHDTLVRIDL